MTVALDTSALLALAVDGAQRAVVLDALGADALWSASALALTEAPHVRYEAAIYGAPVRTLLATVRVADPDATTVLLIGHNPGLSELSALLDPDQAEPDGLRTAGIAVHTLTGAWTDFGNATAPLTSSHTARAD